MKYSKTGEAMIERRAKTASGFERRYFKSVGAAQKVLAGLSIGHGWQIWVASAGGWRPL
jgi:hypothetical protein